jgi:hypothetical protein
MLSPVRSTVTLGEKKANVKPEILFRVSPLSLMQFRSALAPDSPVAQFCFHSASRSHSWRKSQIRCNPRA